LVSYGTVLYAARHDDKLALFDPFRAIAKFHAETAFDHQEHFVFVLVMMKDKFAFELVELYILAIELGGDVGLPVFGDLRKLLGDVDFGHKILAERMAATPLVDDASLAAVAGNCAAGG
jgi:hypothetical protein